LFGPHDNLLPALPESYDRPFCPYFHSSVFEDVLFLINPMAFASSGIGQELSPLVALPSFWRDLSIYNPKYKEKKLFEVKLIRQ